MGVNIVEADIEKDINIFLDLLNNNRQNKVGIERFKWLYLNNPEGKAKAWIVYDDKTGYPIAFTSVLPRLVKVNQKNIICWNCCDFSVNKKYRTLGIAIKLRRKAKESIDNKEISALYAHPNDKMKVIHQRVGHFSIGEMRRYAKLLRVNRHVDELLKNQFLSSFMSPCVNWLLKFSDIFLKIDNQYKVDFFDDKPFDKEYDKLFHKVSKSHKIIGHRTADYLNWRYIQNPLYKTQRIVIQNKDKLCGYIIYYIENKIAVFKDILCFSDENIIKTLLGQWIKKLRKEKVSSISIVIMNHNPVIKTLQKVGFKLRPDDKSSVYAYANNDDEIEPLWLNGKNWYMTVGDRDV